MALSSRRPRAAFSWVPKICCAAALYVPGAAAIGLLFFAMLIICTAPALPAERCMASYYGGEMHGRTASGEAWNPNGMTAAHRTAPFGSIIGVRAYGREIQVRVNDRGPARSTGRCIDLAYGAARALGIVGRGAAMVEIERVR